MKKIGIIGAGRFGMSMAQALSESGVEVVLMDRNGSLVQSASSIVTHAVQGDATNARALEEAGIGECDVAVVAIGSNIEASTLATANCKEIGVNEVIAKALDTPEDEWPDDPRIYYIQEVQDAAADAFAWLSERAEELHVDAGVIANRATVTAFVDNVDDVSNPLAHGWRWDTIGREMAERFGVD